MRFASVEPLAPDLNLPWREDPEQEKAFKRLLHRVLFIVAIIALIIPWLPVFEPEYEPPEQTVRKTELLLEPTETPEPEPIPKPEPVEAAPEPEPATEPDSTTQQEPEARVADEAPSAPPSQAPEKPKDRESVMKEQGLSELEEQLSGLRGSASVDKLKRKNLSKSDLGQREYSTRDQFGENVATKRSQGIQVNDVMAQSDVSLADYKGVPVQATESSDQPGGSKLSYLSGKAGRRDMENIRRTFESAKSSVFALYLRALNDNPNLKGKFIFRLVIEPDGSVSELELVSSELGSRGLENTILDRIRDINFGPKEVAPTAVEYAFSFLPS